MIEFDPKWAKSLKANDRSFKKLANDTLIVPRRDWKRSFKQKSIKYPADVITTVKECNNGKRAFNFRTEFPASDKGNTLYHLVLPEYCYCIERFILKSNKEKTTITTHNCMQSVSWFHDVDVTQQYSMNLGLVFSSYYSGNFEKIKHKLGRYQKLQHEDKSELYIATTQNSDLKGEFLSREIEHDFCTCIENG